MSNTIDSSIFNSEKSDYDIPSLFMGEQLGMLDTVNVHYPEIMKLYDKLKSQDWDHKEFPFGSCNVEFKTCDKDIYNSMITNLAWQWETDSIVGRGILPTVAPFVTNSELWVAWSEVTRNENVHALTYSEIVRNSFDDPSVIFQEILKVKESLQRLEVVTTIMKEASIRGHELSLGLVKKDQKTYNSIFLFVCAMYVLERIQFMDSFKQTFTISEANMFIPIGSAVGKICIDEFEVHQVLNRTVLDIEMRNEYGLTAFNQNRNTILALINEVVKLEMNWLDFTFADGKELPGTNKEISKQYVLWNAKPVYEFFGFSKKEIPHILPEKNPVPFMDKWIKIDKMQTSPQEQRHGGYLLGNFKEDDADAVFKYDDLYA